MADERTFPFTPEFAKAAVDAWKAGMALRDAAGPSFGIVEVDGQGVRVTDGSCHQISVRVNNALIDYAYPPVTT